MAPPITAIVPSTRKLPRLMTFMSSMKAQVASAVTKTTILLWPRTAGQSCVALEDAWEIVMALSSGRSSPAHARRDAGAS